MKNNITITAADMSQLVEHAMNVSMFDEGRDSSSPVTVEGIVHTFAFNAERLEQEREHITSLLAELPEEFKEGYTFLNLCTNKDGVLWTGDHMVCEELVAMAIGLDLMSFCLPREMWSCLPGGMPYVIVK